VSSTSESHNPTDTEGIEQIPGERYEVVCELGTGAFGSVYRAQDTFLNRSVAVKSIRLDTSLDPEQRKALNKRFIREAQVAAQLQHANIVTIHDIIFTPDTGFIVMEFIEGSTLQSLIEKNPLPLARAVDITTQIARALEYAHQHKVIHRDIKPANVMITPSFEVRITDFGIAKSDGATHLTMSGSLVGTPDYMSPEQAKGEEVDLRSDLFSLGCVFYECLTGHKPFKGGSLTAVLLSIVNSNPLESSAWKKLDLPREVSEVLSQALAKAPHARFPNATGFISALESIPTDVAEPPAPASALTRTTVDTRTIELGPGKKAPPPKLDLDQAATRALMEEDRPLRFSPKLSDELQNINLTPAQGYILSRIDGSSCARDIVSLSPVPEAEAAATLLDLIANELVSWADEASDKSTGNKSHSKGESTLDRGFVTEADRILRLARDRRYSELLGIDISTPTADVKKSYLELIQRFHPDAQPGNITSFDRRKLTRVCAAATEALATVSPKKVSAPPLPQEEPERASATAKLRQKNYAEELFARAQDAFGVTDYWEAIQLSRQALELDETNAAYHYLLGLGLLKNQNWMKEAEESLRRAAELDESKPEYFKELAALYSRQGMAERAAAMTAKLQELEPEPEPEPRPEPKAAVVNPLVKPKVQAQNDDDDLEVEVEVDFETEAEAEAEAPAQ
jgi:serine/threonine protein kinase